MKKYQLSEAEYETAKALAKANQNKRVDKRLQVVILRYEGLKDREIAEKLGFHRKRVSQMCAECAAAGLEEYARHKYGGNHRALSEEEEAEILEEFAEKAEKGEVVTAQAIKKALDEKRGKDTGKAYVYRVLERQDWRKVMPRSRHPKAASEAEREASKKLTQAKKSPRKLSNHADMVAWCCFIRMKRALGAATNREIVGAKKACARAFRASMCANIGIVLVQ
jgi:transposase